MSLPEVVRPQPVIHPPLLTLPRMFSSRYFIVLSLAVAGTLPTLRADTVRMTRSLADFTVPEGWSNQAAPSADHDYINEGAYNLRTPTGPKAVFPGKSLTIIGNGRIDGTAYATLSLKINGGGVCTFDDLRLLGAVITQGKPATPVTIEGGITLQEGLASVVRIKSDTTFNLTSTISGPGKMRIDGGGTVVLLAENTYLGGTWLDAGTLRATTALSLGGGSVTVADKAVLELASSQAMAIGSSLILGPKASVRLQFSGTLSLARLSLDGGITFVAPGIWGGESSGAPMISPVFQGLGLIRVRGDAPRP